MTQRRKLSPHTAPVDLMRKKLLQEFPHIVPPSGEQKPLMLLQVLGELQHVRRIGADRIRRQPFLDAQVIEKAGKHARIRLGSHSKKRFSMTVIGRKQK